MGKEHMDAIRTSEARLIRAEKAVDEARDRLGKAIAAALRAGERPSDIEPLVRYKREHIRRIARAHDVPPLREPTVISKRRAEELERE